MAARTHSILFAAALVCVAAAVPAQTIYKHVDNQGRVTFSDRAPDSFAFSPRHGGGVDAIEAERRLKQAQLARARGVVPLPGERTGEGAAHSVNYRYWRRQERLRIAVERARRRTNELHRPLGARLR